MLLAILILLQVVQANDFVEFKVCYLDTRADPWEFGPHLEEQIIVIRKGQILMITNPHPQAAGIPCVRICAAHGCKFVEGSIASVMKTLRK